MSEPRIAPSCEFPVVAMAPGMLGQLNLLLATGIAINVSQASAAAVGLLFVLISLVALDLLCAFAWFFAFDAARGKPPKVSWLAGPSAVHAVGVVSMVLGLASAVTALSMVVLASPIPFIVMAPVLLLIAIPTTCIFIGVIGTFVHMRRRVQASQAGAGAVA